MNDLYLTRALTIKHPHDDGHTRVTIRDVPQIEGTDFPPVLLEYLNATGDTESTVALRWSEWDEVRDHVEHCMNLARPEPAATQTYDMCGARDRDVDDADDPATWCVLDGHVGHDWHVDRSGLRWVNR